ncbi:hypothetical protein DFP72DRAFT_875420 [Ephemerocybe angulata]|uniref:F-box domain-containing protein n=1 Tax=Ephemerocybe angulata TaxID=980116 RepID=A0A8H6ID52_9AGAR|nr:hypothetical protein DFP72DRAFT_875420 [Tulosesus angulatus]
MVGGAAFDNSLLELLNTNGTITEGDEEDLRDAVDQLSAKINELWHRRLLCLAALSPWRRMPAEILMEIFGHVARECQSDSWDSRGRHLVWQVTALRRVCKRWNEIALLTPRLGRHVYVPVPVTQEAYERTLEWFDRAKTDPKTIIIQEGDKWTPCPAGDGGQCALGSPLLAKLFTEGPLLEHVSIRCRSSRCLVALFQAIAELKGTCNPRPWDALKSLRVQVVSQWTEVGLFNKNALAPSLFASLPPVTSLDLDLPICHYDSLSHDIDHDEDRLLNIPGPLLAGLTSLTLRCNWRGRKIWRVLQGCQKNLENLVLDFDTRDYDRPNWVGRMYIGSPLVFPKLRRLRFPRMHFASTSLIVLFKTPALEELYLELSDSGWKSADAEGDIPGAIIDALLDFFRWSKLNDAPGLQRLELSTSTIPSKLLHRLFSRLPGLRHLNLIKIPFDTNAFCDLMLQKPYALPELETFEITSPFMYDPEPKDDYSGLTRYFEARPNLRKDDGTPLQAVKTKMQLKYIEGEDW